jgi:hypothetical protein
MRCNYLLGLWTLWSFSENGIAPRPICKVAEVRGQIYLKLRYSPIGAKQADLG